MPRNSNYEKENISTCCKVQQIRKFPLPNFIEAKTFQRIINFVQMFKLVSKKLPAPMRYQRIVVFRLQTETSCHSVNILGEGLWSRRIISNGNLKVSICSIKKVTQRYHGLFTARHWKTVKIPCSNKIGLSKVTRKLVVFFVNLAKFHYAQLCSVVVLRSIRINCLVESRIWFNNFPFFCPP